MDGYDNEITSPTEIDLYQVNAAVYLEGGKTYSPFITAEYEAGDGGSNDTRERNDSGSSGGGCTFNWGIEAMILFIFFFSMFLNRKFI